MTLTPLRVYFLSHLHFFFFFFFTRSSWTQHRPRGGGAGRLSYLRKIKQGRIKGADRPSPPSHAWAAGPHDRAEGLKTDRRGSFLSGEQSVVEQDFLLPPQTRTRGDEASSPTVPAAEDQVSSFVSAGRERESWLLLTVSWAANMSQFSEGRKKEEEERFSSRKTSRNEFASLEMWNAAHLARCSHQGDTEEPFKPAHAQLSPDCLWMFICIICCA